VCHTCSKSMKSCPQCRDPCLSTPIPNISLLKTLDSLVSLKILVIGEAGVGKSSLMLRFIEEKFTADILPTVGLDFRVKVLDLKGYSVKLSIWDTAGQERFRNITSAYYRGAHGVVLVYDITSRNSFQCLENWVKEESKHAGEKETLKLVVGNKSDQRSKRRVSTEEGRSWAEEKGFSFIETSAKDNSGVEAAFSQLVERILQDPDRWEKDLFSKGGTESPRTLGGSMGGIDGMARGNRGNQGCC